MRNPSRTHEATHDAHVSECSTPCGVAGSPDVGIPSARPNGMGSSLAGVKHLGMPMLLGLATACARPPVVPSSGGHFAYDVEAPADGSRTVVVEGTFENARTERLAIASDVAPFVRDVQVRRGDTYQTVYRRGSDWIVPACTSSCTVRWRVDLGELAAGCGDELDCARRVGDATLAPAMSWLMYPNPKPDVPVRVRVHTPRAMRFVTGLKEDGADTQTYSFRSHDLDEGAFTAFGPMRRYRVDVPGRNADKPSRIDVAILGDHRYAMNDEAIRAWIEDGAGVVSQLFGKFPVDRATFFVVPARGEDEVVFGKVLSLSGASVVLVVGDRMQASNRHADWVLVHEMFHLGFPTFRGEGRWLGEGLATYYEPVLRARAGWTQGGDVFRQFARNMPRGTGGGLHPAGLAQRDDTDSIYWGGALFCLVADVRIREETRGKKSLDDVLRATLERGGDATHVWSLADVVKLGDHVTGTTVMSEMVDRYASHGDRIDLEALLFALGVEKDEGGMVAMDEGKPLSWIRREIVGELPMTAAANHAGTAGAFDNGAP